MATLASDVCVGSGIGALAGMRSWHSMPTHAASEGVAHLVDFEPDTLAGVADLLAAAGLSTRVHANSRALVESHLNDAPACIVLRTQCGQDGYDDFFADFHSRAAGVPIVLAADRTDARTVVVALKAGAVDFVEAPFRDCDILEAVEAAIEFDRRRRPIDAWIGEIRRRFRTLTPREREVMALVTAGRLNKQAAGDLGLSEITVKAHRGAAMRKMVARTITDLVRMADALAGIAGAETEVFRAR